MPAPPDADLPETLLALHQRAHAGWLGVEMTRITRAWSRGALALLAIACAAFLAGTLTTLLAASIVSVQRDTLGASHTLQLAAFGLGLGAAWCLGLVKARAAGWLAPATRAKRPTRAEHRAVGALAAALMPYGASATRDAHVHDAALTVEGDALVLHAALEASGRLTLRLPRGGAAGVVALSLHGPRLHHGAQPLPAPWAPAPGDRPGGPRCFTRPADALGAWREALPGDVDRLARALGLPPHPHALQRALGARPERACVLAPDRAGEPPSPPSASWTVPLHLLADTLSADAAPARREGVMLAWDTWTNFAIFACVMIVAVTSVALRFCLSAEPSLLGALMVAMSAGAFAVAALLWTWHVSPGRPVTRPLDTRAAPALTLRDGLLTAPDLGAHIDLRQPFEATLTRQPQARPGRAWAHLDLAQRLGPVGAQAQRLRLAFPVAPSPALDALDALTHVPALITADDAAARLVPALAYHAALHGRPLPWRVVLAQDAPTPSPEAAQPHHVARATAAHTPPPHPSAPDHEP